MTLIALPRVPLQTMAGLQRFRSGSQLRRALALVAPVLTELARQPELEAAASWRLLAASWTVTGTATFLVGPSDRTAPSGVLRMSATGGGRLQHETEVLRELGSQPALADFRHMVPSRHADGESGPWRYVLDEYIPGVDGSTAVTADPALRRAAQESGIRSVTALHRATARPAVIDEELLRRWVDEPIQVLARSLRRSPLGRNGALLERVRERLHAALRGREVFAGWVHGDFWLGNLRVAPDTGRLIGIIDWDCAGDGELPAHDLVHLALYGYSVERGISLGAVVADVVRTGTWPADCEELIRHSRWSWDPQIGDDDIALLYWLRYAAAMTAQQQDYVHHSVYVWQWCNVRRVLTALRRS